MVFWHRRKVLSLYKKVLLRSQEEMLTKRPLASTHVMRKYLLVFAVGLLFTTFMFILAPRQLHSDGGDGRYRYQDNTKRRERYLYKDVKTLLAEFEGSGSQEAIADFMESRKQVVLLKEKEKQLKRELEMTKMKDRKIKSAKTDDVQGLVKMVQNLSSKVDLLSKQMKTSLKGREEKAHITNLQDVRQCKDPFILFLVTSHLSNYDRRKMIRQNWGNQDKFFQKFNKRYNLTYDVYFNVGTGKDRESIERTKNESRVFGDLLIVDRQEDFYDLTRRLMIAFEWSVTNCQFQYLFKIDDDIFVNIPNLFSFLSNNTFKDSFGLYAGDMNKNAEVNRDSRSKYVVTYDEWPVETYPPYCSGGGFALSRTIVEKMIPYYDWANPYKIDDVYVGMLIQRAKVRNIILYEPAHRYQFWFYNKPSNCEYISKSIVYHKVINFSCMRNLTQQSTNQIEDSLRMIEYFRTRPPPLWKLAKASVPSHRHLQKVFMAEDSSWRMK
ncbi:uncharacterized protein [Clytia hemisphaerica]|uniref:uncharacterized protein n=1 Tax=Clytia hemisphaerica TaxID=252671 RepID=UPI0034D476A1